MQNLLLTILTSAVTGAIVSAIINYYLEGKKSKWSTKFDALEIAVTLEGYAFECLDKLGNNSLVEDTKGLAGSYIVEIPKIPELKVSVGWLRSKKSQIANRLMIFPQEFRQANQHISFVWDITKDNEDVQKEIVKQTSKMGLRALNLAKEARRVYSLPVRELIFGQCNIEKSLETFSGSEKDNPILTLR